MSRLIVFLKGQRLQELVLQENKEFFIGRAENCDLVLPPEKGISRQHFRIYFSEGAFEIEVLSRYGEFFFKDEKVAKLRLDSNLEFSVPPFRFQFELQSSAGLKAEMPLAKATFDEERTQIGLMPAQASLKLLNSDSEPVQIFHLDGQTWTAGRDQSCSILMDVPQMSRRQFELTRDNNQYFIRNLGKSHPTLVNSREIPNDDWTALQSGDLIHGPSWSCQFELRDSGFEQRLIEARPYLMSPIQQQQAMTTYEQQTSLSQAAHNYGPSFDDLQEPPIIPPKKNWVRFATMTLGALALVGYLLMDEDVNTSPSAARSPANKAQNPFEKLKPEQQQFVKQSYRLAKELFMQGRYEMARQEIIKITQFIPSYEDSKDLENAAAQAIQMQQDKAKLETQEKERQEIEVKIQRQLVLCRKKVNANVETAEIDECLSPVIQFNPEHGGIIALKEQVDQIISERHIRNAAKADYVGRAEKQRALFEKARGIQKSGSPLKAIEAYEVVVNSKWPDPNNLKAESKREIASIQQKMGEETSQFESQAEQLYKKGDLKSAILTLKKAAVINPENEVVKGRVNGMLGELKKQMQSFYQEGILEESVGEVETAKAKWKKIIELSLPDEDYYKKASMKLKKYGAM